MDDYQMIYSEKHISKLYNRYISLSLLLFLMSLIFLMMLLLVENNVVCYIRNDTYDKI